MTGSYWINGKPETCLEVSDRAIQYGDGIFETIRVRNRCPEFLPRHLARLAAGSARLKFPTVPWQTLEREIRELAWQRDDAVLKVILSRGQGERGYRFDSGMEVTRLLALSPAAKITQERSRNGVRARICITRLAIQPALAGIKHLNRLEQVLARAEWDDLAIHEGLMLDSGDHLIEGTMSNLFLVRDNALVTPELAGCGVAGIMRSVIIDLAREHGITVTVTPITLSDAVEAQELFVCNSLIGIWPIRSIDELGDFVVGPVTIRLLTALDSWSDSGSANWYPS